MKNNNFHLMLGLKDVQEVAPGCYIAKIADEYLEDWKDNLLPLGAVKDYDWRVGFMNNTTKEYDFKY